MLSSLVLSASPLSSSLLDLLEPNKGAKEVAVGGAIFRPNIPAVDVLDDDVVVDVPNEKEVAKLNVEEEGVVVLLVLPVVKLKLKGDVVAVVAALLKLNVNPPLAFPVVSAGLSGVVVPKLNNGKFSGLVSYFIIN